MALWFACGVRRFPFGLTFEIGRLVHLTLRFWFRFPPLLGFIGPVWRSLGCWLLHVVKVLRNRFGAFVLRGNCFAHCAFRLFGRRRLRRSRPASAPTPAVTTAGAAVLALGLR